MSRLLLFSALNYLFSAPCYLKTAFLVANHNREIFSCILLGPKCQFLASRPLGYFSFQDILTNLIISQINTLLLPYFILTIPPHLQLISSTTTTPKCTLHSVSLWLKQSACFNSLKHAGGKENTIYCPLNSCDNYQHLLVTKNIPTSA